jgi:hypothetical protein
MSNGTFSPVKNWFSNVEPQYVPLNQVAFGPAQVVMPHELPPSSYVFPMPYMNKVLNIPYPVTQVIRGVSANGRQY